MERKRFQLPLGKRAKKLTIFKLCLTNRTVKYMNSLPIHYVYCGKTCQTANALGRVRVPPSRWYMIFASREKKYYKFGTNLLAYNTPPAGWQMLLVNSKAKYWEWPIDNIIIYLCLLALRVGAITCLALNCN